MNKTPERLKVNQKVELEVDRPPYEGKYLSKIASVTGEYIKVTPPFVKGEIMPLRVNLPVKVYFNDKYAAYYLNTVIVDREKEPVHLLVLKNTGDYRKIQRREFFREEVKRKVKYRALDDNLHPVEPFSETYTIDISGWGY